MAELKICFYCKKTGTTSCNKQEEFPTVVQYETINHCGEKIYLHSDRQLSKFTNESNCIERYRAYKQKLDSDICIGCGGYVGNLGTEIAIYTIVGTVSFIGLSYGIGGLITRKTHFLRNLFYGAPSLVGTLIVGGIGLLGCHKFYSFV